MEIQILTVNHDVISRLEVHRDIASLAIAADVSAEATRLDAVIRAMVKEFNLSDARTLAFIAGEAAVLRHIVETCSETMAGIRALADWLEVFSYESPSNGLAGMIHDVTARDAGRS